MKILIVSPSWIGDMVMSHSLIQTLASLHPDVQIDVLAPAWCKPLLTRMPEINNAIEMPVGHGVLDLSTRWEIGRQLAKNGYSHAYILPNSAKSALIPLFAGIPKRIGWKGEFRYGLLNDLRPQKTDFQYMVERYVALAYSKQKMRQNVVLESCIKPKLLIDKMQRDTALADLSLTLDRESIGMCPGAEFGPAKRWPAKYYATVAEELIKKEKQIWLFGSQKDNSICQTIRNLLPKELQKYCVDLSGKTSLNQAVDLLSTCRTVICNDSGLMHVSAAVGCNIIAIYGSSTPKYTPPLSDKVHIVQTELSCRPCFKRECPLGHLDCLKQLKPEEVIKIETSIN